MSLFSHWEINPIQKEERKKPHRNNVGWSREESIWINTLNKFSESIQCMWWRWMYINGNLYTLYVWNNWTHCVCMENIGHSQWASAYGLSAWGWPSIFLLSYKYCWMDLSIRIESLNKIRIERICEQLPINENCEKKMN